MKVDKVYAAVVVLICLGVALMGTSAYLDWRHKCTHNVMPYGSNCTGFTKWVFGLSTDNPENAYGQVVQNSYYSMTPKDYGVSVVIGLAAADIWLFIVSRILPDSERITQREQKT